MKRSIRCDLSVRFIMIIMHLHSSEASGSNINGNREMDVEVIYE